ncbi:Eif4e2 protein [Thecamonas trahens ATCC 50062]|uniref:Eif4e2 protein n=1 Tax=Thecamonas trahens ATCC 50062 TaxID=461836 RepID=A0A0L0DI93_THETB|nr:Eif4e2 protein [Thecamonas trahens ATCC 50062]KNC52032.1 Eif4e2 protein [Thecamonas trahens ATCC 50062]|eukprot:XP_013755615.1 Eif4e2 protein [Thecamonas trahens ATCC 50062]
MSSAAKASASWASVVQKEGEAAEGKDKDKGKGTADGPTTDSLASASSSQATTQRPPRPRRRFVSEEVPGEADRARRAGGGGARGPRASAGKAPAPANPSDRCTNTWRNGKGGKSRNNGNSGGNGGKSGGRRNNWRKRNGRTSWSSDAERGRAQRHNGGGRNGGGRNGGSRNGGGRNGGGRNGGGRNGGGRNSGGAPPPSSSHEQSNRGTAKISRRRSRRARSSSFIPFMDLDPEVVATAVAVTNSADRPERAKSQEPAHAAPGRKRRAGFTMTLQETSEFVSSLAESVATDSKSPDSSLVRSLSGSSESPETSDLLPYKWVFWFDECPWKGVSTEEFDESLRVVGSFATATGFDRYSKSMRPIRDMPAYCNLRMFKAGIKPLWEDPRNVNGGRWLIKCGKNRGLIKSVWQDVTIAAVDDSFVHLDFISGITLQMRARKGNSVAIWSMDASRLDVVEEVRAYLLNLLAPHGIKSIDHQDMRTALDYNEAFVPQPKATSSSPTRSDKPARRVSAEQ